MYEFIWLIWVMNFNLKLVDFRLGWNHKIVSVIHSVLIWSGIKTGITSSL